MTKRILPALLWISVVTAGTLALGGIALNRGEEINSLWLIVAAVCIYAIAYRFYSTWIAVKLLIIDEHRTTPAVAYNDGRDYVPTNKWIVFGHHFAAIAGPGPLIGPTLAAQFGYLPGILWILVGAVLGGCVQDMIILFFSLRNKGKTLGQMAKEHLGIMGGISALFGTLMIMIILISVLGLVVVNAMKHSAWGTFTVAATIPVAMFIGVYLRHLRPGRVLEASVIGFALMLGCVLGGQWVQENAVLRPLFDHDGLTLAWGIIAYGFLAAVMPVWLLLAPRDYLSTFLKLGTISALAIAIIILRPTIHMPALTQFVDGTGPIFAGKVFPFMFITIACGAVSGFHALIASGTTPKLITNEKDIRLIGYGSMLVESFVAVMALIAATILEPGVFFAINSPAGIVGALPADAVATINSWGFPVTVDYMQSLAARIGESTLFGRTGGAPSLAVGMASIFGNAFGDHLLAIWYHFAIMFEAVFILTTLDAGTRVGRFMLQDLLGNIYAPLGRTHWYPAVILASAAVVAGWGYFLYVGVIDPNGGVNMLWPLFGLSNQVLAGIALCVGTCFLVKSGKARYAWVTVLPLSWLAVITSTAAWQRLTSDDVRIGVLASIRDLSAKSAAGLLPPEKAAIATQLMFNQYVVLVLSAVFVGILWIIMAETLRSCLKHIAPGKAPYAYAVE